MAKGIIVVEMPDCCAACDFLENGFCKIKDCDITEVEYMEFKPDWCPIQPMPEKKPLTGDVENPEKAGNELVRAGWNACIDEILKGADENG